MADKVDTSGAQRDYLLQIATQDRLDLPADGPGLVHAPRDPLGGAGVIGVFRAGLGFAFGQAGDAVFDHHLVGKIDKLLFAHCGRGGRIERQDHVGAHDRGQPGRLQVAEDPLAHLRVPARPVHPHHVVEQACGANQVDVELRQAGSKGGGQRLAHRSYRSAVSHHSVRRLQQG